MTKKIYFAISYSNRKEFNPEIEALQRFFQQKNIELLVFVDKYNFSPNQEKEMMQTAFQEIDNSDILIAELTTKSIGVGIEIGYAFAKRKSIIYLKKTKSEYSTTAAGSADEIVEYTDTLELIHKLERIF